MSSIGINNSRGCGGWHSVTKILDFVSFFLFFFLCNHRAQIITVQVFVVCRWLVGVKLMGLYTSMRWCCNNRLVLTLSESHSTTTTATSKTPTETMPQLREEPPLLGTNGARGWCRLIAAILVVLTLATMAVASNERVPRLPSGAVGSTGSSALPWS